MDEYLDHYLCASTWSNVDAKEKRLYEDDGKDSPGSILSADQTVESLAAQDTTSADVGGDSDRYVDTHLLSGGSLSILCNEKMNGSLKLSNAGVQYDPAICSLSSESYGLGDMATPLPYFEPGYIPSLQTHSSIPDLWPHEEVSPVMGQDVAHGFGLLGANFNNAVDTTATKYIGMDKILQYDHLSASLTAEGKDLQNHPLSAYTAVPEMTTVVGLSSLHQATSTATSNRCNGTTKPRVRARRGQATDPHSIAERLRREKIAERMKNLQELVPNSNKTDKASMLDEIIDYVKFLQLQVKVLSMSRLGAADAVLPLITDTQPEGSNGLSFLAQAGLGVDDMFPSPDQLEFEEEVVKLMESNVTMAMQYLQSKGLCLMPIALASAISNEKRIAYDDRKSFGIGNNILVPNGSREGIACGCNVSIKEEEIANFRSAEKPEK